MNVCRDFAKKVADSEENGKVLKVLYQVRYMYLFFLVRNYI